MKFFQKYFNPEMCYRFVLILSVIFFLSTLGISMVVLYRTYRQYQTTVSSEQQQWRKLRQLENKFEIQQEHIKELSTDPDFIEHVARERMQMTGDNEILFKFE